MYSAWNFYKDTKLKKLFFGIENYKDETMQSPKVIFPLTMSHVIIIIPKEEHKKNFCAKIHKIFLLKKQQQQKNCLHADKEREKIV